MSDEIDLHSNDREENPRLSYYKLKTPKSDQEARRCRLLTEQKRRRDETFSRFREFSDVFTYVEEESRDGTEDDAEFSEEMHRSPSVKPKYPRLRDLFMFSEWMTQLPIDFRDSWVFMVCPVGKRCLVRSCKGSTTVYGKKGFEMARFRSSLPNGGQYDHSRCCKFSKSDVTVLDCMWSGSAKKYFILDVLYWKSQSYLDTDVGFRQFWIRSKIEETPDIMERSKKNPYPFVPLNHHACDAMTASSVMSIYPYFDSDVPQVDGILFYHREGYYTPGVTPLVLWLKPYMLPEVLGEDVCVAEEYLRSRPPNYTNMFDFITGYEDMRKEKERGKRRRRRRKDKSRPDAEECMDVGSVEEGDDDEFVEEG